MANSLSLTRHREATPPTANTDQPHVAGGAVQLKASLRGLGFAEQEGLLSPSAGAGTAVQRTGEDAGFKKVAESETPIKQGDSPESMTLPKEASEGMDTAYKDSFPDDKAQEQGGIMVRNDDGTYGFTRGAAGIGGTFSPNYGDKGADQQVIGSAHTHPYDQSEGGHKGVAFSGADVANLIYQPDKLKMVEAGGTQFVLVRTEEFQKQVDALDAPGKEALHAAIEDHWDAQYAAAKGTFPARCEIALKSTVQKYKLSFYKGKEGKVDRVDTSK
jgi:hypothetical protein